MGTVSTWGEPTPGLIRAPLLAEKRTIVLLSAKEGFFVEAVLGNVMVKRSWPWRVQGI